MKSGVGVLLIVVALVLVACGEGGDSRNGSRAALTPPSTPTASAEQSFPSQGNDHLIDAGEPHPAYNSDPPTSGWHVATLPRPGIYTQPRRAEELPHFMEHGGVWVLYNCPNGCDEDIEALRRITDSAINDGRPVAMAPFPSMDTKVAVVAWQYLLKLEEVDRGKIDNFIGRHACRYNPEGGPYCSGVHGKVKDPGTEPLEIVTGTPFSVFGSPTPAATPPR